MEKTSSKFIFEERFINEDNKEKKIFVILYVDYISDSFNIKVYDYNIKFDYIYVHDSTKQEYKNLFKIINKAIDFGIEELENYKNENK